MHLDLLSDYLKFLVPLPCDVPTLEEVRTHGGPPSVGFRTRMFFVCCSCYAARSSMPFVLHDSSCARSSANDTALSSSVFSLTPQQEAMRHPNNAGGYGAAARYNEIRAYNDDPRLAAFFLQICSGLLRRSNSASQRSVCACFYRRHSQFAVFLFRCGVGDLNLFSKAENGGRFLSLPKTLCSLIDTLTAMDGADFWMAQNVYESIPMFSDNTGRERYPGDITTR